MLWGAHNVQLSRAEESIPSLQTALFSDGENCTGNPIEVTTYVFHRTCTAGNSTTDQKDTDRFCFADESGGVVNQYATTDGTCGGQAMELHRFASPQCYTDHSTACSYARPSVVPASARFRVVFMLYSDLDCQSPTAFSAQTSRGISCWKKRKITVGSSSVAMEIFRSADVNCTGAPTESTEFPRETCHPTTDFALLMPGTVAARVEVYEGEGLLSSAAFDTLLGIEPSTSSASTTRGRAFVVLMCIVAALAFV